MNLKEILEVSSKEICFPTPVGDVYLSPDKCRFSLLYKKYKAIVSDTKEKFVSYCKYAPQNEEDLKELQEFFNGCREDIYRELKKDFISMGGYYIDNKAIDKFMPNMYWRFEAIVAALYDLLGVQRYSCSYRELYENQVMTFKKVVGVGVEDYITEAGIVPALHSSFNGLAFNIVICIFIFIGTIMDPDEDIDVIDHNVNENLFGGDEELGKCRRLMSNIKQGIIPDEKKGELLLGIAQINPFNAEIYINMIRYFGDQNMEVQNLAEYLGYENEVISCKEQLISNYCKGLPMKTEEEALMAKENFENYCVSIGYDGAEKQKFHQVILDKLEELDRIYRTVDGIVCGSRESADLAREELEKIKEFMSHVPAPASDSLLDYEWALKDRILEFDMKFSSELKAKYAGVMEQYLKDFDNMFCTVGLFRKLDRKAAGQERLLKLIKKCDVSAPDKIVEAYKQMEELLPKVGLEKSAIGATLDYLKKSKDELALNYVKENLGATEEEAKRAREQLICYCGDIDLTVDQDCKCIQYIDKILADFDLKYRTVDQVVCETREGADFARSELDNIRKFMKQVAEPTSESLLDYESDLIEKRRIFEESFQSELKQKYLGQFDQYLSDFDKKFCSMGIFKKGDRKQAARDKALKYVKKLDCSSPDKVSEAYVLLEEFLPRVGITLEEADEAVQYLEKKRSAKGLFGSVGKLFGK